jgi:arylsulfatase A-like enzyme
MKLSLTAALALLKRAILNAPRNAFRAVVKTGAVWLACHSAMALAADATTKPNIIFILADDLGWKDLGCYGSYSYQTPNIDRLRSQGMKFTQAYAYPSCSPTRASVMSGMDPARLGITVPVCHQPQVILQSTIPKSAAKWQNLIPPIPVTRLDTKVVSFASILKEEGYVTAHFGKWHLGREPYSPLQHGFDIDIPHVDFPGPSGSYLYPWNKDIIKGFKTPGQPGEHLEDHMAGEAAAFIEQNKDKPFVLDYWAFSVHSPLGAKPEYIAKNRPIFDTYQPQRNPTYAAMVESLDDAVGTLMNELEKAGIADRTIVIFMSDNGGLEYYEGGPYNKQYQGTPATNNTPLRQGKGWVYEGGVRVPLIVKWPSVVTPNATSEAMISSQDLYPTILEMCGAAPRADQPLDGMSFVPVLKGGKETVRTKVYCVSPQYCNNYEPVIESPAASIHTGEWKLIHFYGANRNNTDRLELYNLKDDIGETFDMSAGMPQLTAQLSKQLDTYIASIHAVMPQPNPKYDPTILNPPIKRQPSQPLNLPQDGD